MINSAIKIISFIILTYSSNFLLLVQRFYNIETFINLAFIFAIYYSFFSIIGGSFRLLNKVNIESTMVSTIVISRLLIGLIVLIALILFDQHLIIWCIIARKTFEWILDPIITFFEIKDFKTFFPILIIDSTLLMIASLNLDLDILLIIWTFIPIIILLLNFKKFKLDVNNFINIYLVVKKNINFSFFNFFIGFEGPAALSAILFRGLVALKPGVFLADALFLTMILSALMNIILKVIIPSLKEFDFINIVKKNYISDFLMIHVLLLFFLIPYSQSLPYYACLYLFMFFFILQFIAMISRNKLINSVKLYKIVKIESTINLLVCSVLVIVSLTENYNLLGWFYIINASFNWIFYNRLTQLKS